MQEENIIDYEHYDATHKRALIKEELKVNGDVFFTKLSESSEKQNLVSYIKAIESDMENQKKDLSDEIIALNDRIKLLEELLSYNEEEETITIRKPVTIKEKLKVESKAASEFDNGIKVGDVPIEHIRQENQHKEMIDVITMGASLRATPAGGWLSADDLWIPRNATIAGWLRIYNGLTVSPDKNLVGAPSGVIRYELPVQDYSSNSIRESKPNTGGHSGHGQHEYEKS